MSYHPAVGGTGIKIEKCLSIILKSIYLWFGCTSGKIYFPVLITGAAFYDENIFSSAGGRTPPLFCRADAILLRVCGGRNVRTLSAGVQ
jgi:hypothetical protein